jgi:putative tricarboxylic transport membrane protein
MRAVDSMTAALLMLLSAAVIYEALRLGAGWGSEGPESGFFPFWLAILLAIVSIVLFVQALRRRSQEPFVNRERLIPVLKVL